MTAIDRYTGKAISAIDSLKQRLLFCFKTRVGTLPLRRQFGSNLPNLIDQKMIGGFDLEIIVATTDAVANPANGFTNEFKLIKTSITKKANEICLVLEGQLLINGESITLEGLTIS